jgi:hypothetical protein
MSERDLVLLACIGEQYAYRFDQMQKALGRMAKAETVVAGLLSESATRHTIDRWEAAGFATCRKILADGPRFIWLTPQGLRAAGLPFRAYEPKPAELSHLAWCVQARLKMQELYPAAAWQSERWLRHELTQRMKRVSLPDALLYLEDARPIALEIELSQKNVLRLEEILQDRTLVYAQVWYFAPPAVRSALQQARDQLDELYQHRVAIRPLEDLL